MRIVTSVACLAAIAALSACKQEPSVTLTNATPDQVMQQASTVKMKPGEWEITAEVKDMKVTGAPAGAPPMPQQAKVVTKSCLTQEQADKPTAMLGKGLEQFKDSCVYDRFEMKGGRIEAKAHCDMPQGPKVVATTEGTFSETAMSTSSETEVTGMPGGMGVTTKMSVSGKRLGDCPAAAG